MQSLGIGLGESLAEEYKAAQSLLDLLRQEQAFLIAADVDGLARLTEEKAGIAARMSALSSQRHRALAEAGVEATEPGMHAWANGTDAPADVRETWNGLLMLAQSAKELNRVNGMLINQHMARNQNALNVLHAAAQGGNFYGPDGQSTTKLGGRRLAAG
ncbi:flagellar protein FlgN [Noviherbaspirillum cavernae]|uniref:Flagellar protein FlgN n=1 Tax=Noviherbaspirillum cavernae TaxID=2320862 RepID=A0A418X0F5_9BURK|nr:flagellar protein FlgN [Noviherbaspirillum cavernae]RJG05931.1 flagellar protein FlgN [Noviherbaspirillum cavernae]